MALKNAGVDRASTTKHRDIALFVEAAEAINEFGSMWKYWKKNHNNKVEDQKEELADILHFLASRGIDLKIDPEQSEIIYYDEPIDQICEMLRSIVFCGHGTIRWERSFAAFRGLLEHLEIEWDEMVSEYWKKHEKNIARQEGNY